MKTSILPLALAIAAALPAAQRAWSAPDAPAGVARMDEVTTVAIKLNNVPPSWMAQMVNPAPELVRQATRERKPGEILSFTRKDGVDTIIRKGTPEGDRFEAEEKARPKRASVFGLPEGVESVTPDDASGDLQARGTREGIARLRQVVEFLDLPLRRVQVEVLSVRVNKEDVERFGIQVGALTNALGLGLGFLRGDHQNYQETLQPLLDANRASPLLDVRASVVNNTPGFFSSGAHSLGAFSGSPSFVPTVDVQLTPTINNDDTITVVAQALAKLSRSSAAQPEANGLSVANVRDGETFVLMAPDADGASRRTTLTFLTARIVRRAGEAK